MMLKYDEIKENVEVIRTICKTYRAQLTEMQGNISEVYGLCDGETYRKIMDELSEEEFTGNMCTAILNTDCIDVYKQVISGEMAFEDFVKLTYETFGVTFEGIE